jgi:hypothetical protein
VDSDDLQTLGVRKLWQSSRKVMGTIHNKGCLWSDPWSLCTRPLTSLALPSTPATSPHLCFRRRYWRLSDLGPCSNFSCLSSHTCILTCPCLLLSSVFSITVLVCPLDLGPSITVSVPCLPTFLSTASF